MSINPPVKLTIPKKERGVGPDPMPMTPTRMVKVTGWSSDELPFEVENSWKRHMEVAL